MNNVIIEKIENILTSEYSTQNYVEFIQEVFDTVQLVAPDHFREEFTNFSTHIAGSSHVGNYIDSNGKKILFFSVRLVNKSYVETSRSTQRSYAKKLIENSGADGAIIAFYTVGDPKWRISFVRLDYEIKFENGKLKTTENITPAKRYSFIVGKDEPCHTAIDRFRKFIVNQNLNPTLDEIEEAFSVEAVTNEFFNLYCEKFKQLLVYLEENEDFRIESEHHNFTAAQFAKKLMGQIVFLYFLQKKGWLGVGAWPTILNEKEYKNAFYARGRKSRELIPYLYLPIGEGNYKLSTVALEKLTDEDEENLAHCVKGKPWGSGPHNFMRKLFNEAVKKKANFFDDYLEPLFYNALNNNRGEQGYDPKLHCRIPFLSGGLFEPIDGYDWENNDFAIPNEVFSNRINNNARTGNGILDIFDRYNFTMSEDEPLEREVAIDPEMLGKVFENLLEVNDRKAKGAFYTPREIVHYMCQESLINYLKNTMNVSEQSIREFIVHGDFMKDEDTIKEKRLGNGGMLISDELYKISSEGHIVVNRLNEMDEALANVKIADPAVGSGAFPLGMLNEIVRARQNISAYMAINMNPYETRMMYSMERSAHQLKYDTIRNCIFAADLDPSAVDIAQLRLWLSLVIDDEINPEAQSILDGHKNPLPLPNLECNIVCGNSLNDCFKGVKLINKSELLGNVDEYQQQNLSMKGFDQLLVKIIDTQEKLFVCQDTKKKQELLKNISDYKNMIVMHQMEWCTEDIKQEYVQSRQLASKPYVLWQLDFARVFKENGGFDIVIGNPPYVQLQKKITDKEKIGDQYKDLGYKTFTKSGDLYCLFYEKGISLLKKSGALSFITSNKWMKSSYGKLLRKYLAENTNPLLLIDFGIEKVFDTATVDTNIMMVARENNLGITKTCQGKKGCIDHLSEYVNNNFVIDCFNDSNSWVTSNPMEKQIKSKISCKGKALAEWNIKINRGILTGYNDAFYINNEVREELILKDSNSEKLIHPILRGKDIQKYKMDFANLYVINTHNGSKANGIPRIDVDEYPAIKEHLNQYYDKLVPRYDQGDTPYNLRNCKFLDEFKKKKIAYRQISEEMDACLLDEEYYVNDKCYFVTGEHLTYLLCIFNSQLFNKIILKDANITGGKGASFLEKIKVPVPNSVVEDELIECYQKLQKRIVMGLDTLEIERIIDQKVNNIYELNDEEIAFLQSSNN